MKVHLLAVLLFTLAPSGPLHGQRIQPVGVHTRAPEPTLLLPRPTPRALSRSSRTAIGILVGGVLGGAVGFALGSRGGPCDFDRNRGNCGFGLPLAVGIGVASGAIVGGVVGSLFGRTSLDQ